MIPASSAATKSPSPAPTHFEYEFLGPVLGPAGILIGLPLLVWSAAFFLRGAGWHTIPSALPTLADVRGSFSWEALLVYAGWVIFQAILYCVVPGATARGTVLRDGSRLEYPLNGFSCLLVSAAAAAAVHVYVTPLTWLCDNFLQLSVASILVSTALSAALYAASFRAGALLAPGGDSGVALYDFFIGRELNPRLWGLDLKYMCELRPGLFAWLLIDAACALREVESRGSVSAGMVVVLLLQGLYVLDALWSEEAILTTMDITTDGFGFMLAFGDLAWVPAMYSLQARFLADISASSSGASSVVSPVGAAIAFAVGAAGYVVFRAANAQKDLFKRDPRHPSVRDLPTIGGRLLAGGWWGMARHVNYAADLVLALGMSLATGFSTCATYFYPLYFAVLLWHRELRDDHKCGLKYGKMWEEYKARVPWRILPGVY